KVFDPCQILKRLVSRTGFFYTPYFCVLSAAMILTAAGVTITHWGEFREELPRLYSSWASIAVVIFLNFLVVGAHEFGHGLTCTRFGGEVHEMGCALIFLQPAFYCNVSDAWLFPGKSKRLWVGFAGPYFELFLWSLAVLTWRMTEPDTWINFVTLSVMATFGLLGMRYRRRFRRMFGKASGSSGGGFDDEDFDSPEDDIVSEQPPPAETAVTARAPDRINAPKMEPEKHVVWNKESEFAKSE